MDGDKVKIIEYKEVTSTNDVAKEFGERGGKEDILVVARKQTAGRGRMGRDWVSEEDMGIYMSLLLFPEISPNRASRLTLVMAMAVEEAIREMTGLQPGIKWPNDIVLGGRKVCGILTEMSAGKEGIRYVIIGAGINIKNRNFPEEIRHMATSLEIEGVCTVSRKKIIQKVLQSFAKYYTIFCETQDLSAIMDGYNSRCVNRSNKVEVLDLHNSYTGIGRGINSEGELIVETAGKEQTVSTGEVSVRGIYGYV